MRSVLERTRHARRAADRRRQVAVLPGAGADAARAHRRRLAAHLADEGPGRRAQRARPAGGVHQQHAHRARRSRPPRARGARRDQAALRRAGAVRRRHRRPSGCARWACRCSRSTRRTASASGATTSGRATCACATCASDSARRRRSRSRRRRRRKCARTSSRSSRFANPTIIVTGFDRTNLHYHVVPDAQRSARRTTRSSQTLREHDGLAVVYAATRKTVERIAGVLERARIPAAAYHAGLDDAHRHEVQDSVHERAACARSSRRTRSAWASTSRTCGSSSTTRCRARSRRTTRRPGAPAATASTPSASCCTRSPTASRTSSSSRARIPERALVEAVYDALQRDRRRVGHDRSRAPTEIAAARAGQGRRRATSSRRSASCTRADAVRRESRVRSSRARAPARDARAHQARAAGRAQPGARVPARALARRRARACTTAPSSTSTGCRPGFSGASRRDPAARRRSSRASSSRGSASAAGTRLDEPERTALGISRSTGPRSIAGAAPISQSSTPCRNTRTRPVAAAAFVLRYFGDEAGRGTCGGCDNCLGLHAGKERHQPAAARPRREARCAGRRRLGRAADACAASESRPGSRGRAGRRRRAALRRAARRCAARIAREEQVPAYVVFPDRTLAELARATAANARRDCCEVRGVGPAKLDKYGERFLAAIRGADETEAA